MKKRASCSSRIPLIEGTFALDNIIDSYFIDYTSDNPSLLGIASHRFAGGAATVRCYTEPLEGSFRALID
jgi:hypothetical protein